MLVFVFVKGALQEDRWVDFAEQLLRSVLRSLTQHPLPLKYFARLADDSTALLALALILALERHKFQSQRRQGWSPLWPCVEGPFF